MDEQKKTREEMLEEIYAMDPAIRKAAEKLDRLAQDPEFMRQYHAREEELQRRDKEQMLDLILTDAKAQLSQPTYKQWFSDLAVEVLDHYRYTAVLSAADRFTAEWLKDRYAKMIQDTIRKLTGVDYTLSFIAREGAKEEELKPNERCEILLQLQAQLQEMMREELSAQLRPIEKSLEDIKKLLED